MLEYLDRKKRLTKPAGLPEWPMERHLYARFLREVQALPWDRISEMTNIPLATLHRWSNIEGWQGKGSKSDELVDFTRKRFLKMAENNGMPQQKAVKLLVEGMTKPMVETTREKITEDGGVVEEAIQKPDYDTRHKYQKDYWVLAGLYATGGVKGATEFNAAGGTINVQVVIPAKAQSDVG